jgi:undecaprenyl-diphosphatase
MLQTVIQALLSLNGSLFFAINAPAGHTPVLDHTMPLLAEDAILLFPVLILLLWWIPGGRDPAASSARSVSREAAIWAIVAALLALALNVLMGTLIPESRPFVAWPTLDHQLVSHAADASFPSDHAAISFAIVGVLLIRFWLAYHVPARPPVESSPKSAQGLPALSSTARSGLRWRTGLLAALGLLLAIAIGYARVYVGIHYPFDILGGAMIGLLAAWVVSLARGLLRPVARLAESVAHRAHLA